MDFEDVFCSRVRMKILKMLAQLGELNVSEITRRLGINYETTKRHLDVLEAENIVLQRKFGRIRLYKFDDRSPKTRAIQILLDAWNGSNTKNTQQS